MIRKTISDFNIEQIAASGQCFRMEPSKTAAGQTILIARDHYLEICPVSETTTISGNPGTSRNQDSSSNSKITYEFSCTEEEFNHIWRPYFDLDFDYSSVKQLVPDTDIYLKNAVSSGSGIRILHQDLWETLVSFLISQQNNIPRIKRCIRLLCEAYGKPHKTQSGQLYYGFPSPEKLASASLEDLRKCNLGYRAKYILRTAQDVAGGVVSLDDILGMSYTDARQALLAFYGVGVKVADCICLFALHHAEAFPIDTHIRQVLNREYPAGFPFERYPGCAGILQQYIFYHELS